MKYIVGYLGNNEFIENALTKYYNSNEQDKIEYINLADSAPENIEATSFNGLIFDASMHQSEDKNELIDEIISGVWHF